MNQKELNNLSFIAKDIVEGDSKLIERDEIEEASFNEIRDAFNLILNSPVLSEKKKKELIYNSWRILYRVKPPSIQEFLSVKWLGLTANNVFPYVADTITKFYDPTKPYRNLILAPHIGWGKSTASVIINLFTTINLWCMHNPKKYFNLIPASVLVQVLISFSLEKAKELLLDPFLNILESSSIFHKVRTIEGLHRKQEELGDEVICYTTAGTQELQFSNNLNYKIASSARGLLGLTVITSTMSELSFFMSMGFSPEEIWQVYNDSKSRIDSRLKGNYWGRTIIDSSPNDLRNPIDNYIFNGEASKNPSNFIVTGAEWEWKKHDYVNIKDTFPVFKGNAGQPAKIIENEAEILQYPKNSIIHVPKEKKQLFVDDLVKSLKDIAGVPAGEEGMLFSNDEYVENIFYDSLRNHNTYIIVPEEKEPRGLIWEMLWKKFFVKVGEKNYEFYRNPSIERYIHVDQSESSDMTGIVMAHPEIDSVSGEIVVVADFTIAVRPGESRINLDAIVEFIIDLRNRGRLNIVSVTYDGFQSTNSLEKLKRNNFNAERYSVDIDKNIYYLFAANVKTKRIKVGKNIFLKNNLKSLKEVVLKSGKKKIDHMMGRIIYDDGLDWNKSNMGINAKDISDPLCAVSVQIFQNYKGVPNGIWKDSENIRKDIDVKNTIETISKRLGYNLEIVDS